MRTFGLLLAAALSMLAACGARRCGAQGTGTAEEGAPRSDVAPRDRILGAWSVSPSRAAMTKMKADLTKAARGDEQKLAQMLARYEQSTAGTTLDFTGSAMITRAHERVHVRQYEWWGPLFVPAYLLAGLWALIHGGHPYFDNRFEREARLADVSAAEGALVC